MADGVIICSRAPMQDQVRRIAESATDRALRALGIATSMRGAPASSFVAEERQAALSWGLIEATQRGRRYNPTPLGWAVERWLREHPQSRSPNQKPSAEGAT